MISWLVLRPDKLMSFAVDSRQVSRRNQQVFQAAFSVGCRLPETEVDECTGGGRRHRALSGSP